MKLDVNIKTTFEKTGVLNKLEKALEVAMYMMEGEAIRKAPVDTGNLRAKIKAHKINPHKWILSDGVDYGVFLEYGTEPHIIRPKFKKALKFKVGGKVVFAKVVHHPGTNAQPYFRPALDYTKANVKYIISEQLK